jgi:hypothetical protein
LSGHLHGIEGFRTIWQWERKPAGAALASAHQAHRRFDMEKVRIDRSSVHAASFARAETICIYNIG